MHTNLLHKVLNLEINHKYIYLNKKCFYSKILREKLLYTYNKFTIEMSLSQVINIKKHSKIPFLSRLCV